MEYLFEQVRHSQSVVVLADARGMLMHTLGDPDFLSKAERVALTCGASWPRGSVAPMPSAPRWPKRRAVEDTWRRALPGAQRLSDLRGLAHPVGAGAAAGHPGHLGRPAHGHPHTLGLVSTAARMIENRLVAGDLPAAHPPAPAPATRGHWHGGRGHRGGVRRRLDRRCQPQGAGVAGPACGGPWARPPRCQLCSTCAAAHAALPPRQQPPAATGRWRCACAWPGCCMPR
jgi:hypothetical protein